LGADYRRQFVGAGVSTDNLKMSSITPTGRCLSLVTPDAERTMRTFLGAAMNLRPSEIDTDDFSGCTHMHMEAYLLFDPDLAEKALQGAKDSGCSISMGLSSFEVVKQCRSSIRSILDRYVDVVFANEREALAYSKSGSLNDGLQRLSNSCQYVSVTLGSRGAVIHTADQEVRVPAYPVKAVDVTAAGDLWAAGLLYGILNEYPLEKAGLLASFMAAKVIQHHGSKLSDHDWSEVIEHLSREKVDGEYNV
jgi:sugar/nucleoside kinase (ribokinase family)